MPLADPAQATSDHIQAVCQRATESPFHCSFAAGTTKAATGGMMQLPCTSSDMATQHSKGNSSNSASHGTAARSMPDGKGAASNSSSPTYRSKSGQLQDAATGCSVRRSSASTLSLGNTLPSSAAPSAATSQQVRTPCISQTLMCCGPCKATQTCQYDVQPIAVPHSACACVQGGAAGGPPAFKACRKCGVTREASCFQMDRHNVDGLQSYCRRWYLFPCPPDPTPGCMGTPLSMQRLRS